MSELINKQTPETPIITIERDNEQPVIKHDIAQDARKPEQQSITIIGERRPWLKWLIMVATTSAIMLSGVIAIYYWQYYYHIGVPVSVTPAENIEKLKASSPKSISEVVKTSDSILDVAMDFYALHGLHSSIEFSKPDSTDTTIYLYTRCADYTPDKKYIGSLVVNGKDLRSDKSRLGYMAMTDDNMVIGIGRSDKVKDYVKERNGSFFRQFILVSDGVLPSKFHLHGKVERCAIGRIGDTLYYITTRNKETLWDFADALREYGFIDAIYITGGKHQFFYRTLDGQRHDDGEKIQYTATDTVQGMTPWLVFRSSK